MLKIYIAFLFAAAKNLELMCNGSAMLKVKKSGKTFRRTYQMEDDYLAMFQTDSHKIGCARKMMGKSTDVIRGMYGQ